jgi:hypothetical protein
MEHDVVSQTEQLLGQLTPRNAPRKLRNQVLSEIDRPPRGRGGAEWGWWFARSAAASLLLSIGLNGWVLCNEHRRMARLGSNVPARQEVTDIVETITLVTDETTARRVRDYLIAASRTRSRRIAPAEVMARPNRVVTQLLREGDLPRVKKKASSGLDRRGAGSGGVDYFVCCRNPQLVRRSTA